MASVKAVYILWLRQLKRYSRSRARIVAHSVAVLEPGPAPLANRQRCAENAAVGCMAGQPEPVLPSAIRTPSDMAIIRRKPSQRRVLAELIRLSRATLADLVKRE